eukprot:15078742-Alexandrium_andersonii.AAC.1
MWKQELVTPNDDIAQPVSQHPIMQMVGITRFHYPGDLMHTGDLGVVLWLLGSVLSDLVATQDFYQGNMDQRVKGYQQQADEFICSDVQE